MPVFVADLHFFEGIANVGVTHLIEPHGVRIVRLNGDYGDAAIFVIFGNLLDSRFVELRRSGSDCR